VNARQYSIGILEADTLEGKLVPPPRRLTLIDREPPLVVTAPRRPPALTAVHHRKIAVPPLEGMRDPSQRARILHALANHELQAVELFAWALLAFPAAPRAFRAGLVKILADEQRHLRLYDERLAAHGTYFGAHPVTAHFWNRLPDPTTPLPFLCTMGLTFENANLDFAPAYAAAARAAGDPATADALDAVHADEISHVRFAFVWLRRLAPDQDPWAAYLAGLAPPLGPSRARGATLDEDARRRAGLSSEFIAHLAAAVPRRPNGSPR
jgi:uncharacterized ferritin-like protein (DUF455 family)